jgi:hypothetical protein
VPIITYLVIQKLRPRLSISCLQINERYLKIKVTNTSNFFDVNNIRVEICVFNEFEGWTYHFEPDHSDFLIIPHSNFFYKNDTTKIFVTRKASESALLILNEEEQENFDAITGFNELTSMLDNNCKVRVRCHAYHSFSGLGKSFEKVF